MMGSLWKDCGKVFPSVRLRMFTNEWKTTATLFQGSWKWGPDGHGAILLVNCDCERTYWKAPDKEDNRISRVSGLNGLVMHFFFFYLLPGPSSRLPQPSSAKVNIWNFIGLENWSSHLNWKFGCDCLCCHVEKVYLPLCFIKPLVSYCHKHTLQLKGFVVFG